jgi:hypothetical protein
MGVLDRISLASDSRCDDLSCHGIWTNVIRIVGANQLYFIEPKVAIIIRLPISFLGYPQERHG